MNEQPPAELLPCGIVALVGRASTGKSTLLNALLGEKVSIVSPIPQTTRGRVRGILNEPRGQLVFLDTPGLHQTRHDLGRLMNRKARAAAAGADVVVLVLDAATPPRAEDESWMRRLAGGPLPCVLALNKVDQGARFAGAYRQRWAAARPAGSELAPPACLELSALSGAGLDHLLALLFTLVPKGPPLFPDDVLTDYPRNWMIADVVREQYLRVLRDELPHVLAVAVHGWREAADGWDAEIGLYVQKESQKPILIGRRGANLRKVREAAQRELAAMYRRPVRLRMRVKVRPGWDRDPVFLKRLGYDEA